jgi:uncharacterized protein (DUF2344 family)
LLNIKSATTAANKLIVKTSNLVVSLITAYIRVKIIASSTVRHQWYNKTRQFVARFYLLTKETVTMQKKVIIFPSKGLVLRELVAYKK